MVVRVSTGGFNNLTATEAARLLNNQNIWDIELSAGLYEDNLETKINNLISLGNRISFHNYYPRPKKDFVLNLGSQDPEILNFSRKHCLFTIELASKLNIEYYSIHAGFCIDPLPENLGSDVGGFQVKSYEKVKETFLNELYDLASFSSKNNVKLLVENNVTSKSTFKKYNGQKVLLMSDLEDTIDLIMNFPKNVGWLCDVAHLKVSAKSFGYDPTKLIMESSQHIKGYHLSDNNGYEDSNQIFNQFSWFMDYLKFVEYVSIEVYSDISEIKECWLEAKKIFG